MPSTTIILDQQIQPTTSTYTEWFSNCKFLVFQSSDTGEYVVTGEFLKVAVVLYVQISSGPLGAIERIASKFQGTINNYDLIVVPSEYRNDCFPFRLSINPSTGFHARILAISC